jgi:hypothetical protein
MIALVGWIGSVVMVIFSFTLWLPLAMIGLSLLTIQATATKTYNLVALNVVSLIGFVANYIGSMV